MVLTKNEVDSILYTLIEHEYIDAVDVYDKSEGIRDNVAQFWVGEAHKAWKQDKRTARNDEAIRTILNISPADEEYSEPRALDKLPVPSEPDFDYTHLPGDFTELTDIEIRRYSSHNQHFLNRARYLLANVINHLSDANHLKDEAYRTAYKEAHATLVDEGVRPTKDLIDTYAMEDGAYLMYDKDAHKAQRDVTELKALVEIYSGNVERLSREWTMRQNEWEKSR